jgi:hypothetical protein
VRRLDISEECVRVVTHGRARARLCSESRLTRCARGSQEGYKENL